MPDLRRTVYRSVVQLLVVGIVLGISTYALLVAYRPPEEFSDYVLWGLIALAAGLFPAGLLNWMLYRSLRRSFDEIVLACRQIVNGTYQFRFTPSRFDEFNRLFVAIGELGETIRVNSRELRQKQSWLEAVLNSIQDGLIVLDDRGMILIANRSFGQIAGGGDFAGRYYWQAIRHPVLSEIVTVLKDESGPVSQRIDLADRHFLINAARSATGEKVITFSDISEIIRTAEMKRDFIQNVSHELRTPLTAIKGYVETLSETVTGQEQTYLNIIKRHTDRLIRIVQDLMTLSRLETDQLVLEKEKTSVRELITDAVTACRPLLERKRLELKLDLPEPDVSIWGDRLYLEQALVNLLENAVRYTEKGWIKVSGRFENNDLYLTVEDTGIGIPAEHLPRIFERFYVVDRGRSRQSGGTGLGLAIVKHIVSLHNGEIRVESTPGVGSKFTLILPVVR
ncbi:MAG: ATP-binding protein [candidate division WOR-3 bacterium]|nr:ATP-binding protein [candidate division WOR-3 bacterium]